MFIKAFGKERISVLLADREFIGPSWIGYLQKHEIPFSIRIKEEGQYITNCRGEFVKANVLCRDLRGGETKALGLRYVGKQKQTRAWVSATRSMSGELLVVIHDAKTQTPCHTYEKRWQIECLFKSLKSGGFNMEDTRLRHPERIETLLALLTLAFCYVYDWGNLQEPQAIKCHGEPLAKVEVKAVDKSNF